jgi:regulator of ribonuclease activity A
MSQLSSTASEPASASELSSTSSSPSSSSSLPLTFVPTCDLYDRYLDRAKIPQWPTATAAAETGGTGGSGSGTIQWRSFGPVQRFCGYAVTVKCYEDNSRVKELLLVETAAAAALQMVPRTTATGGPPGLEQLGRRRRQHVLVVDGGSSRRCALLGDQLATAAAAASDDHWAGLVIYGCVRDVDALSTIANLGLVALGCTPRSSVRRGKGLVNVPVSIGDVTVNPGDAVYVDHDGVVFLDPSLASGNVTERGESVSLTIH